MTGLDAGGRVDMIRNHALHYASPDRLTVRRRGMGFNVEADLNRFVHAKDKFVITITSDLLPAAIILPVSHSENAPTSSLEWVSTFLGACAAAHWRVIRIPSTHSYTHVSLPCSLPNMHIMAPSHLFSCKENLVCVLEGPYPKK